MRERYSLERILERTGGSYVLATVAAAQLLAVPGALLSAVLIQLNAEFTLGQFGGMLGMAVLGSAAGSLTLFWIANLLTPNVRKRLEAWQQKDERRKPDEEENAWKEITAFSWRYGIAALLCGFVLVTLLVAVYFYSRGLSTYDQYIYTLIGGLVTALCVAVFGALVVEHLLTPARLILLPRDVSQQIAGRAGLDVERRIRVVVLAMVAVGILIIGPTGYHYILKSMQTGTADIVPAFQAEVLLLSALVMALGFGLAYFATRPTSTFLQGMVETFTRVEAGDLTQRAPITATDETAELAIHFNRMIARLEALQNQLEQEIRSRAGQLEATFEVGQTAHTVQSPDQMLEKLANLIGERFGYYFVAMYQIDPSERWADLRGATGAAGQVLLANKHRIDLTERNPIVLAITSREAHVSRLTAEGQSHNPLLPYTRSEAAVPLVIGDRIYGVLDVHATKEDAFGDQEVRMLHNMANQAAAALENMRLFEEAQQSLQEMRASQRSYLKTSWDALSSERPTLGYVLGEEDREDQAEVAVPLVLRDQKIGEISLSADSDWTPEERSIIEAVAAQAALALENARLVEESQASAARDHLLADITAKIWSAATIDSILQTAVKELGRALETDEAVIELKVEE